MEYTQDELKTKYDSITELYDLAEELVSTVETSSNPEEQLRTVEPLIDQVGEATDILCEEFIEVAGKQEKTPSRKNRMEGALRKIYMAMDAYRATTQNIKDVAGIIVDKIQNQVEAIIAMLVDFIDLALDRIMQKQHIDELKERQEKIANMLYVAEQKSMVHGG